MERLKKSITRTGVFTEKLVFNKIDFVFLAIQKLINVEPRHSHKELTVVFCIHDLILKVSVRIMIIYLLHRDDIRYHKITIFE